MNTNQILTGMVVVGSLFHIVRAIERQVEHTGGTGYPVVWYERRYDNPPVIALIEGLADSTRMFIEGVRNVQV